MRTPFLASLVAAAALVAACGGGEQTAKVDVSLKEWEINPLPAEVRPGNVRLEIRNDGTRAHQLVIIKSDLPPGQLPTADAVVDAAKVNIAGSIERLQPGSSASLEVELFPGKYVLICNLVDRPAPGPADPHYLNGMATSFLVLDD